MPPVTLVWFRRDLRLDDNPALAAAAARGPVVPLFIWAPEEEHPWEPGAASRWWLHASLGRLSESLAAKGTPLVIRRGPSLDTLRSVAEEYGVTHISWNRCYEPAIVARDTKIKQALQADGLEPESFNGGLLFEPLHVKTKQGSPYQVFTPFWKALLQRDEPDTPRAAPKKLTPAVAVGRRKPTSLAIDTLGLLPTIDWDAQMRATWTPGEAAGSTVLKGFLKAGLHDYGDERDRPDHLGTSRLSPYLHFGEISPRRVWHAAREAAGGRPVAQLTGSAEVFLREIGWREFASHLLFHFPHTTDAPLRENYARFPWVRDPVGLRDWQRGQTGFPVVDAGMRQLWQTGWMHNRVRMIVASFLVKDLRVSWHAGAKWFWDTLVDADLAANTLGWQWAAGCGADAAPYFRIFNPTSQGKKFDPDGSYVRQYVPELAKLPASVIHQPEVVAGSQLATAGITIGTTYPEPIVDHSEARKAALAALATLKQS
ncbi:MAG: deoxyribodipyrimidine photo-lyase [Pirellulales bacterium]|jgi:deoxyribodipyrimidine photo-lyase|nr:deoxyribodipyrimidine photo-lyase [Pirellulales bacterium]